MKFDIYNSTIAVLIDLWDNKKEMTNQLAENVVNFVNTSDHIEITCGGIYELVTGERKPNPSLRNLKKPYIDISSKSFKEDKSNFFDPFLLEKLLKTSKYKHIKNICIMGAGWNKCVKYRPLGYINLKKLLPSKNIVINKNFIHEFDEEIILNDEFNWVKLKADLSKKQLLLDPILCLEVGRYISSLSLANLLRNNLKNISLKLGN